MSIFTSKPKILRKLLAEKGDKAIRYVQACRLPIRAFVNTLLNVLTFGEFKRRMKAKNYDQMFHLYLVFYLEDGSVYMIEKNQRINIVSGKPQDNAECTKMIPVKGKTLNSWWYLLEASVPGERIYRYSAFKNNCQRFVLDNLHANGIVGVFDEFVLQSASDLAPGLFQKFANLVTDVAAVGDYAVRGGSKEEEEFKKAAKEREEAFRQWQREVYGEGKMKGSLEKEVEAIYKRKLQIAEKELGNGVTYGHHLDKFGKKIFGDEWKGVFARNKIPKKRYKYMIVNLDRSDEPGSHWIGLYRTKKKTYAYDSFGRAGLIDKKWKFTDPDPEQKQSEENCGARVMAWLMVVRKHGIKKALLI